MKAVGLYDPAYEHDSCGVAFVARLDGVASHETLVRAATALANLEHRGAEGADALTGDGAGMTLQLPDALFRAEIGAALPPLGSYGVAVCFLPRDAERAAALERLLAETVEAEGQTVVAWRDVPVDERHAGASAAATAPLHPAALRRCRAGARGGRLRAQAVRDPAGGRARRRSGPRDPELLGPHRGLQGHADGAAAHRLLPGSAGRAHRLGARSRALPLLDEHLPELGARASVPDDRPQRRDQHAAGQRQLDERARVAAGVRALRRRPREDPAGRSSRRLRLGDVRQRARAARARGPVAAARDDDDDPRGLPGPRGHLARARRVLRLPPVPDGGLGRPGGDRVHRRARDRRDARPQRPASGAVARDRGRLGDPRLRDGCARGGAGERRAEGAAAAREAVPRRRRSRPDRPGRRSEANGCLAAPLRRVVPERGRPARGSAGAREPRVPRPAAAHSPARVRLHAGRHEGDPRSARAERGGGDRVDGQRSAAGGALRPAAGPLLVLQAAVRPGDEPADRLDPRGGRDERRGERRLGAQPARRDAGARAPARDRESDPARRGARAAPPDRLGRLPRAHDRHDVAGRGRAGGSRAGRRAHLRRGGRGAGRRREHHRPLRSRRRAGARAGPVAPRGLRPAPPPGARRHAPAGRADRRVRRAAQRAERGRARRVRRGGREPVSDARDARRARRSRSAAARHDEGRGAAPRDQGDRQGPAEDDLEDGHLDDPVVLRRPGLRGDRALARARRPSLHRHRLAHRRDRDRGARRATRSPATRAPTRARTTGCCR